MKQKNYVKERCIGKEVTIDVDNAKHLINITEH